jgi:hypothetical protein
MLAREQMGRAFVRRTGRTIRVAEFLEWIGLPDQSGEFGQRIGFLARAGAPRSARVLVITRRKWPIVISFRHRRRTRSLQSASNSIASNPTVIS